MATSTKREPLTRGEKVLGVASLVVVATILGSLLAIESITREPEVHFPTPAPLPTPNGYDAYTKAAASIVKWTPAIDEASDTDPPKDPGVRAQRYGLPRREKWLAAQSGTVALFHQAQALACRQPSQRVPGGGRGKWYIYDLARWKAIVTETYRLRGDWNRAMRSGLEGIELGIEWPRGGGFSARLAGASSISKSYARLEGVPEKLSLEEAAAAAKRLEGLIARRASWVDAVQEEKWIKIHEFFRASRSVGWMSMLEGSKTKIVQGIVLSADECIVALKTPYSAPTTRTINGSPGGLSGRFQMAYSPQNMRFSRASEATRLDFLLLRLALRAYTVHHGAAPKRLANLAPRYLKSVPTDVFADDAPYRYKPMGRAYQLWSVGPDMKDDGGKSVPRIPGRSYRPGTLPIVLEVSKGDWVNGENQ